MRKLTAQSGACGRIGSPSIAPNRKNFQLTGNIFTRAAGTSCQCIDCEYEKKWHASCETAGMESKLAIRMAAKVFSGASREVPLARHFSFKE
jgi:hypothetical protein